MPPRAKPFSGRLKKEQLQARRLKKNEPARDSSSMPSQTIGQNVPHKTPNKLVSKWDVNGQKRISPSENPIYSEQACPLDVSKLAIDVDSFYKATSIPIPRRPLWDEFTSKEKLEAQEQTSFQHWLKDIYDSYPAEHLGYFEQNLEVWRQFWRVCEMSDVLVVVVDVRFPVLHFPMSLCNHLREKSKKPFVIAVMKCDLVSTEFYEAWKSSLEKIFPDAQLVSLSIYRISQDYAAGKGHHKRYSRAHGVEELVACIRRASTRPDNFEWDGIQKRLAAMGEGLASSHSFEANNDADGLYTTIGFIGHPNVGKSSLINAIVGKKVVSASRTPGHTKHFQTIHLSRTIRLCDCPGLIFPVLLSRHLQVLNGLYNVAQLRDPFGALLEASKLAHLHSILNLKLPEDASEWSIYLVCQQFAIQRGFYTSKAGRPDVHRAANSLLRAIMDGKILIAWRPLGYEGSIEAETPLPAGLDGCSDSTEVESTGSEGPIENNMANRFTLLTYEDDEPK